MATIRVTGIEPNRIGVWQRNAAHFGGTAYVCYGMVVDVADTDEVLERIGNGLLALSEATPTPPWIGYDSLNAGDIITQIAALGDIEKIITRQYEAANQNRTSVMNVLA